MKMENLQRMKECLISAAEEQVYGNLEKVNTEELGEVMDMIKDLSEAVYYCTITEAMKHQEEAEEGGRAMYYTPYPMSMYNDGYRNSSYRGSYAPHGQEGARNYVDGMIRRYDDGQMSYSMYHDPNPHTHRDGMMQDPPYNMARDPREGKSGERRKMYMDGKGYKDKSKQIQELEQYMQELANDISEMIQDASQEEKQLLQQKIATLAAKIK